MLLCCAACWQAAPIQTATPPTQALRLLSRPASAARATPSSTAQADTSGLFNKDFDENSLFSVDGTAAAFEPSLGWVPACPAAPSRACRPQPPCSVWADEANLSARTETAIEDAYTQWYDNLSDSEQEGFAEAWPMIKDDAAALLEDKDAMAGRLEDVGLDARKLTFSEKDWNALEDVVDPLVPEAKGEY